jgi:prepilin signal peptidase PulO-like enzyme (type II secretory pathway)
MPAQYDALLSSYQGQGQRAYVIAFIYLFLNDLFSSNLIILFLLVAFFLSLALLRSWQDGLITGLSTGIIVALLSLYVLKTYSLYILKTSFPQILVSEGFTFILLTLLAGAINGLAIGLAAAAGGAIVGRVISHRLQASLTSAEAKKNFYRCPRCGAEFESNPEFCSNCGEKIK